MWELLYETFWDRLEHFCCNLCRDEARAEDLTQEVFLRALQKQLYGTAVQGLAVYHCTESLL